MMGAVSRACREAGGRTVGAIPKKLADIEFADHHADELHIVDDMRVRKALMDDFSDAFITLPGGAGTMEEFFEIWVGGKEVISIGKGCLLGANSGLGISLGDNCIIESGTYITAASKVLLPDGQIVKARELSGATGLLFRRNSQSGGLEVIPRTGTWGGLNSVLHAN